MTWIMHENDDMEDKRRLLEVKLQNNVVKLLEKGRMVCFGHNKSSDACKTNNTVLMVTHTASSLVCILCCSLSRVQLTSCCQCLTKTVIRWDDESVLLFLFTTHYNANCCNSARFLFLK